MSGPRHTIAEAVEAFDDDALLKMMRHQLVTTFPAFDQNPRVKAARDRLMREVEALPDLLEACATFEEWLRREDSRPAYPPGTSRASPGNEDVWRDWYDENLRLCGLAQKQAAAALKKARGE